MACATFLPRDRKLREGTPPNAEYLVAWLESLDLRAHLDHRARHIEPWHRLLLPRQPHHQPYQVRPAGHQVPGATIEPRPAKG